MIKAEKKRKSRSGSKSQGTVPAFLLKTYEILENPVYNDIISWNREGNAFIVKKINEFSEKILPKYFKHNNFASFVRQLNMYDFHKSRQENNENEFRHKLFKRGQKHLLSEIKRKISEVQSPNNGQLVPVGGQFDVDKFKKEATHFTSELGTIRRHHNDLEKVTKMIYNQNTQLLKENKLLWNELIKNKEKYERKIEKLMLFIFSVMHYSGNQIGSGPDKKSLTNQEISETLSQLTGDPEQTKKLFDQTENGTINFGDMKGNEKFFNNISNYFKNKGGDTNLDSLLEQIQTGKMEDLFKNQAETADEEISTDANQSSAAKPLTEFRGRRTRSKKDFEDTNDDEEYGGLPKKHIKAEPEPNYCLQQNVLSAQKPINLMNHDMPNEELRADMQPFSMDLSRGPSFIESNPDILRLPSMHHQKSSNDFLFNSPKDFNQPMKADINDMENLYDENNKTLDLNQQQQQQKNEIPYDDTTFSPSTFMNPNGYNFGQPYNTNMYRQ